MVIMESPDDDAAAAAYSFSSLLPPLIIAPDEQRRVKFLCSFGGSILPRPLDGKLRYVGGETRIVSVPRDVSYEELMFRMRDLFDGAWSLKYQQPEEDLDALISVVNDDDVTNMMEEYDKLGVGGDGFTRLRIFLFSHPDHDSGASSNSPVGAQFDSSDERDTERRYVDALNSLIDGKPQFSMDALAGGMADSRNLSDPFLSHAQFNMHHLNISHQRYSDAEGSRSPVYRTRTPGQHHLHDPREFPPSPPSRPHHPAFETSDRISEEYVRQTPSQQSYHHPNFVDNLVWLPPGGISGEKAGFPGNLGHIHNVCEPGNVCEHCIIAAARRNPLTAPEARFHDTQRKHWQTKHEHLNSEGECIHVREGHLANQENGNFDRHEWGRFVPHHQLQHLQMDRNGINYPVPHGNIYDLVPPNYIHDDHHHIHLASEPTSEVFHDQVQYGAHVPAPVVNFGRPAASTGPLYETGMHSIGQIRIPRDQNLYATNNMNKVFPIIGPTTYDKNYEENPGLVNLHERNDSKHQIVPDVLPLNLLEQLPDSSKISDVNFEDTHEFSKRIDLEDHLDDVTHASEIIEKELSLHVSEPPAVEEDLDTEETNISEIEPTVAEEEARSNGLQTIKNSDLEEIRELGCGTYGSVYHGKWKGSDVAIKRIKASCFAGKPSERKRLIADFWKEALILSSLHHPNVVSFYGIVRDGPDGSLATVTEFMVNGSLKQVLHKKDRTIDRRKRIIIAMDAAFGMEYLHGKNIVHFDLKCENLLVNMRDPHRPVCKIGDLGLSKVKQKTLVSGGVRGTLPWMAPELLSGKTNMVSEKVDVYSFGVVLWEVLTGEEPYAEMHCASIIGGIVNNTLRPTIPAWCDPEWKALMETCWSTDPVGRPSFAEVSQRLRKMAVSVNVK